MLKKQLIRVKTGQESFEAEVADNIVKKFWGLSLRNSGKMLFVFSRDVKTSIDMMLLSEPLYLYFLDSDKKVVEKMKAQPWTWSPRTWKLYRPEKKYRYLLESFQELKLEKDDVLEFEI